MIGIVRTARAPAEIAADARLRGATVAVVEGPAERRALLVAIGRELRFPARHRPDLDALLDRLTDLAWLPAGEVVLVWAGSEALRQADARTHRTLVGLLAEAVEHSAATERPLHVVLTSAQPLELPD